MVNRNGRRTGLFGLGAWLLLGSISPGSLAQVTAGASRAPLQLGVLPITSTRVLLRNYQHLQQYLERELGQPIELVTAPDFRSFQRATLEGRYDLIATASHLGRQAQLDAAYLPLARYSASHRTLLLMSREQPVRSIEELRGRSLSGPDAMTLAAMDTLAWLQERGLRTPSEFNLIETPTPPSAIQAVLNGQSLLAIGTPQGLMNTPVALREKMDIFARLPEIPSLMWLAHPRIAPLHVRIRKLLLDFTPAIDEGRAFYEATGYEGLREILPSELRLVDSYVARLREMQKAAR